MINPPIADPKAIPNCMKDVLTAIMISPILEPKISDMFCFAGVVAQPEALHAIMIRNKKNRMFPNQQKQKECKCPILPVTQTIIADIYPSEDKRAKMISLTAFVFNF